MKRMWKCIYQRIKKSPAKSRGKTKENVMVRDGDKNEDYKPNEIQINTKEKYEINDTKGDSPKDKEQIESRELPRKLLQ